jgi:hypothetical protein
MNVIHESYKRWDGTESMNVIDDDGGRTDAGYKGHTGDCACRAIAIATQRPHQDVYALINSLAKSERKSKSKRKRGRSHARTSVHTATMRKTMTALGWVWVPKMKIGSGCTMNMIKGDMPKGRIVVRLSKHFTAVIDDEIHDIYDPQRTTVHTENGIDRLSHRCVYGYWQEITT